MFDPAGDMDKRKKYFRAVTVALLLIALSFAVLVGLRDRWFGRVVRPERAVVA